jgi:hypothetical protein
MGEALVEEHKWLLRNSGLVDVLEVAHTLNWMRHILVVVLGGFGTSRSVRDCVAAVAEGDCSSGCWIATDVDLLLANLKKQISRGL